MYYIINMYCDENQNYQTSVKTKSNLRQALTEFHSYILENLLDPDTIYSFCIIINELGQIEVEPFIYTTFVDDMGEKVIKFNSILFMSYISNNERTNLIEMYPYQIAEEQFYINTANLIQDKNKTDYIIAVIDDNGEVKQKYYNL